MQSQSFSGVKHMYIHTQKLCRIVKMRHIHTSVPTLNLVCTNTHTYRGGTQSAHPGAIPLHTDKQLSTGDLVDDETHIHPSIYTLDCLRKHIRLSHLQERYPYTHAALHATCVLISPIWDGASQQRRSFCRMYSETSGHGTPVFCS